jgi:hypothetical protein
VEMTSTGFVLVYEMIQIRQLLVGDKLAVAESLKES